MITKRVQYRYDSVRNKIGMTDADGGLHSYTYDVMRRLTGVINPLGERTTYTYDLNGRRTSVQLANGTRTSYVYDVASRVQSVHTLKSDDSTVSKFEYEYDGNGRRTSVLEADGSRVTWTYDSISQVTSEWRTGTNPYRHTFTYDKVGNRTLKIEDGARTTLVYDAANQLVTSEDAGGTTTFTYDGNGNQTVVEKPSGDRTTQVWDYENRLIKTIQPSGGVTSMAYDADGLRLKKEDATGTKLFVWDDQNYLAETDATGTTETAFTTEPSTYGSLISHRKSGASTTYHFDALGSTRALTDASEAVLERYNYTAFGTLLGSPTLLTPFLWGGMVGYYWDAALASQYIRARHYQPTIARWLSLDPIGFAGGDANLFRYVGNSPTSGGTGMRVRLAASDRGNLQLECSGRLCTRDSYGYVNRSSSHAGYFFQRQLDPSGHDVIPIPILPPTPAINCRYHRGAVGFVLFALGIPTEAISTNLWPPGVCGHFELDFRCSDIGLVMGVIPLFPNGCDDVGLFGDTFGVDNFIEGDCSGSQWCRKGKSCTWMIPVRRQSTFFLPASPRLHFQAGAPSCISFLATLCTTLLEGEVGVCMNDCPYPPPPPLPESLR